MDKTAAFGAESGKDVYLYKATPLMPMWPSFSNSIALHDSSFRITLGPKKDVKKALHGDATETHGLDFWGHATNAAHANAKMIANVHYGPYGATTGASADLTFHLNMACSEVLSRLSGFAAAGPYPSLNGICDCKRTTMEVAPFEVEYTLTCPGWLGYLINNDAVYGSVVAFTYRALISIQRVHPVAGMRAGGTLVTVYGSGFIGTAEVRCGFGDVSVTARLDRKSVV